MFELNKKNEIQQIQDITTLQSETAQTQFHNGIISASIVSLSKQLDTKSINHDQYLYINLKSNFKLPHLSSEKRILIIDAATENPHDFSVSLQDNYEKLKQLNIFDIISASCYYPAKMLGTNNEITINTVIKPILWRNCDLVTKSLTEKSEVVDI